MRIDRLLSIDDLSGEGIASVIQTALLWQGLIAAGQSPGAPLRGQETVGLIFLEPSTRTRMSFERAAQVAGFETVLLEAKGSSFEKGETLEDALWNLIALGVRHFVVRTSVTGELQTLNLPQPVRLLNGGDGTGEHPSQALLDLATLVERFGRNGELVSIRGLKLTVAGDLKHSRVAGSWVKLAAKAGIELTFLSPPDWSRPGLPPSVRVSDSRAQAIAGADAIMALRVQKERMTSASSVDFERFRRDYQIGPKDLAPHQALLHPGPVNWGVELDESLRHDPRSLVLRQVAHGLAVRTVLLTSIA